MCLPGHIPSNPHWLLNCLLPCPSSGNFVLFSFVSDSVYWMLNQSAFKPPQERVRADARWVYLTWAPCVHLIPLALASCTHSGPPSMATPSTRGRPDIPTWFWGVGASQMVGLDIGYVFGSKQPQGVMLPATPFSSIPEETVLILLAMNINSFSCCK